MATVTAASISVSDSLERFRQEFNTLRSDVSNITSGNITINNESNNRILTSVSTNTFNAESGLTYDGSTFAVSGAVTISGLTTFSGNLVIPNAGNIGSAGDTDAIAIASDGKTTFSQQTTHSGGILIANAGNIGSAGDTDAIAIASDGVVTFSQAPVFPDGSIAVADLDIDGGTDIGAGLADADLFIVDDGAGGTNRKTAASRIKTYVADVTLTTAAQTNITSLGTLTTLTVDNIIINGTNIGHTSDTDSIAIASDGVVTFSQAPVFPDGSIAVADLDIDGGTDIGAGLADADLFIVDDGAGGTNRKTAASRIKTYVADVTLTTAAQTNITSLGTLTTLTVDNIIINGTNIGHTSDTDSIAIASDGVVTFSQAPVFPDGSIAVADLDIDGATDIGAAIVDADLFIIDDGAGGTNRKTTASRIKTYIGSPALDVAFESSATDITMDSVHTFSHGLGVRPTLVEVWIKCTDGERGWATGDYLLMAGAGGVGGTIDAGLSIQADATNVEVLAGPEIRIHDQSTFNEVSIVASKWDFVVVAYGGDLG